MLELNARLDECMQRLRASEKNKSKMAAAQNVWNQAQQQAFDLRQELEKEKADVEALQSLTLTGLIHAVLGDKHEKLYQEKQDIAAAQLKYENALDVVKEASNAIEQLQLEKEPLGDPESDYQCLMQEKEELLAQQGGESARQLMAMTEKMADLQADCKELREAIVAGEWGERALQSVRKSLKSASNWGTYDVIGGGLIATTIKHSRMDEAKQKVRDAQRKLQAFQRELADTGEKIFLSLEIGSFSRFADYFFDGLIADLFVQSKIGKAQGACEQTLRDVSRAREMCERRLHSVEQEMHYLERDRAKFIETAD